MKWPTVLCVDDYDAILALYVRFLGQSGYEVIAANNGHTALDAFQSRAGEIDVVILDFQMPGMNGLELAASLKSREPALPILIVASGPPALAEMAPFVDAALAKGSPLRCILNQLELLLAS